MIRRRRSLLTLASTVFVIASVPGPASAEHPQPDPYYPVECHSGMAPPINVRASAPLFSGFAGCSWMDENHVTIEVSRADGVEPKGIVLFDDEGDPGYAALRPGFDQVIVKVSDGWSEGVATIDLEITPIPGDLPFVDDQVLSGNRIVELGSAGCPEIDEGVPVSSCTVETTARTKIRKRGKKKRTVTIATASATVTPGEFEPVEVKLSKKLVRVLKQARQMKINVVEKTQQTDPFGFYEHTIEDDFRLFWSP